MLTVISMFSPCTQWVFGPLSPVTPDPSRASAPAKRKKEGGYGPFHRVKLTFVGEAPQDSDAAEDFKAAETNLKNLIEMAANRDVPTEGGFTEPGVLIIRVLLLW